MISEDGQIRIERNPAEYDNQLQPARENGELALKVGAAVPQFGGSGLIGGRRAMSCRGNPDIAEFHTVIAVKALRMRRETRAVERPIQELPGTVAREHTSCSIRAMRAGGQSENEQTGGRISERGYWFAPVIPVKICAAFRRGNLPAVSPETRTSSAGDDLAVQCYKSVRQFTKNNTISLTHGSKRNRMVIPVAPRIVRASMKESLSALFRAFLFLLTFGVAANAEVPATPSPHHKTTHRRKKVAHVTAVTKKVVAKKKAWAQTWDEPTFKDSTAQDKVDGENLVVRKAAADALGPLNGSVVVVDPYTGRVLTMVNQPLALSGGFQPCSTIKVSVALAALNEKLVARTSPIRFTRRGSMDLTSALAYSNNYYFANLGVKLGYERMNYYARLFGYGEKAGLDIPGEHPGTFPPAPPKEGGMGMLTSFGEEISQTPLEFAALIGAVANGGTLYWLQYPTSQREINDFQPQIKRKLDIAGFIGEIKPGMRGAVDFGTAKRAKQNDVILGKTGTCSEGRTHLGWFGSFNESGSRKLVVVVMLTGGRASIGATASLVAGDVYKQLAAQNFFKTSTSVTAAAILSPQLLAGHSRK